MKLEIDELMKSKEFKHWLAKQGATFSPSKGSHLKVYVTTQGNHKGLPLHMNIFGMIRMYFVVGAILYGCPE